MRRLATLMFLLGASFADPTWAEPEAAPAEPTAERRIAYEAFTRAFEAGRYNNALAAANRVLKLTQQIEPESLAVASALNNVGAVQLRLGDHLAAEQAYLECLQFLERTQGSTSKRLVNPLRGLGMTYHAMRREPEAVEMLQRAASISRRSDGLFNPTQLELIEPLVEGYVALGLMQDAEREEQYAYRTLTVRAGKDQRKLVPALDRLARWYETTGRTTQARNLHLRAYSIATNLTPHQDTAAIRSLRGVARTYVLEYQNGPEITEEQSSGDTMSMSVNQSPGQMLNGPSSNSYVLGADGERALQIAASIARRSEQPPAESAALILDLADWYLLSERPDKAATLYEDAARLLAATSPSVTPEHSPLAQPELLLFRPPPSARRNQARAREDVDEKVAILEYTVTAAGRVADLKFVEGDITDSQRDSLLGAFAKAIFRPRVVDGKPVDTPGQRHRQVYRTLKKESGD